ncbi:hypothetical protein BDW22DRAFT_90665 [Trametopsis cervina]|nr:hypothetical protein BDW22DRAFT_90665 [Trametopsis cervina]
MSQIWEGFIVTLACTCASIPVTVTAYAKKSCLPTSTTVVYTHPSRGDAGGAAGESVRDLCNAPRRRRHQRKPTVMSQLTLRQRRRVTDMLAATWGNVVDEYSQLHSFEQYS